MCEGENDLVVGEVSVWVGKAVDNLRDAEAISGRLGDDRKRGH